MKITSIAPHQDEDMFFFDLKVYLFDLNEDKNGKGEKKRVIK